MDKQLDRLVSVLDAIAFSRIQDPDTLKKLAKDGLADLITKGGKRNQLEIALDESVKLQSHYAELLNQYDSGERMTFENAESWIARLKEMNLA